MKTTIARPLTGYAGTADSPYIALRMVFAVKDWLGHKSIQSTLEYAKFRNEQRSAEARRIYQSE